MVERRWQVALAVVAVLAPGLAVLPPQGHVSLWLLGWMVSLASVAAAAVAHRALEDGRSDAWASLIRLSAPSAYVIAVVLLRESQGGGASGFSPLLLLPLFWVALTADRRALALLCVSMGVALVAPIMLQGAPDYPGSEWRRAAIWLLVAPTAGLAVQGVVEQVRRANVALEQLARTDPLTGLLNRRGFLEIAEREVLRARRTGESLVIAMLDLDHFKRFNDTQGHEGGDRLLTAAAITWSKEIRDIDVLGRWGGEEFIILLPKCPAQVAHNVLDRVRGATPESQTCSVGFALWRPGEDVVEMTARADEALYRAKDAGRNQVVAAV